MAIENSGKGEAIKAIRPDNDNVFHLVPGTLQARRAPPDTGDVGQGRRLRIDGYGGAISTRASSFNCSEKAFVVGVGVGVAADVFGQEEPLQLLA